MVASAVAFAGGEEAFTSPDLWGDGIPEEALAGLPTAEGIRGIPVACCWLLLACGG